MSKGGGAGKVYFVLYLAVVLELLIIIVERDEAEEHLRSQTKQAMKIVESILSQLQSGAGTEGINTRPKDEIMLPPDGVDVKEIFGAELKPYREYNVDVGVTDITSAINKKENETSKDYVLRLRKLAELANVEQLQYQVFYNSNTDPLAPHFPDEEFFKKNNIDPVKMQPGENLKSDQPGVDWKLLSVKEINLDIDATYDKIVSDKVDITQFSPVYPANKRVNIGDKLSPSDRSEDSVFFYSDEESMHLKSKTGLAKRTFKVFFQPPTNPGWYKLRFSSRTNRILGVKGGLDMNDVKDDATVNIGTVQLTVADLRKVMKELNRKLEGYDLPSVEEFARTGDVTDYEKRVVIAKEKASTAEKSEEVIGNINLYGYILRLLVPGQSVNFDQNKGSIEFDVRVLAPKPNIAKPQVASLPTYIASFDKVPAVFNVDISPYQGGNTVEGRVIDASNNVVATLNLQALDQIAGSGVGAPSSGGTRQYRATVTKELPKGKYKVEVTHRLGAQSDTKPTELEVFETKLTDESERNINAYMNNFAFYGFPINFNVEPSSGGKIKANQFNIYLMPNGNTQTEPYHGLSVPQNSFKLTDDIKDVTVRVTWMQEGSNREVDIFPAKSYKVKQEEPSISFNRTATDVSGTVSKIKVRVSGIRISSSVTGTEGKLSQVAVRIAGEPQKRSGLETHNVSTEPIIEGDPESGYTVEFELSGKLSGRDTKVAGVIDIPISAVATNPNNGVKSEPRTQNLSVNINYEPERSGPQRRR